MIVVPTLTVEQDGLRAGSVIGVGSAPVGMVLNHSDTRLHVAISGLTAGVIGPLQVIDTATATVVAQVPGVRAERVALNPAGTRLYTAETSGIAHAVDTATNTAIAETQASSLTLGSAKDVVATGTRVFLLNQIKSTTTYQVSVVDPTPHPAVGVLLPEMTVVKDIPISGQGYLMALNPAGTRLYVINAYPAQLTIIDVTTETVTATIPAPVAGSAYGGLAVARDGTKVYISDEGSHNTIDVFDTTSNTFAAPISLPAGGAYGPGEIALNPTKNSLYVLHTTSRRMSEIDLASGAIAGTWATGSTPKSLVVTASGTTIYVSSRVDNTVSVFFV